MRQAAAAIGILAAAGVLVPRDTQVADPQVMTEVRP
jgi:hypothetical protein